AVADIEHRLLLRPRPLLVEVATLAGNGRAHGADGEERAQALVDDLALGEGIEGPTEVELLLRVPGRGFGAAPVLEPTVGVGHADAVAHLYDVIATGVRRGQQDRKWAAGRRA